MSKRQERKNASLGRRPRKNAREPYDVVLIVCEGEKTEPDYLDSLKSELRLSNANIRVCGKECGSAPESVVEYALQEFKRDPIYDRIFCVFDKDRHTTYSAALDRVRSKRLPGKATIEAITSIPCFEIWLLLHFEDTTRSYVAVGSNSAGDQVVRDLKQFMPDYEKGYGETFAITYPMVDEAIKRAERLDKRLEEVGTDNPSTKIHRLVAYLRGLKS
jgi:hypothetical protein